MENAVFLKSMIIFLILFASRCGDGLKILLEDPDDRSMPFNFNEKYNSNIIIWLDASKPETLYAVSVTGDPIPLANGERITKWGDNGSSSNHLIKYNPLSGYPTYVSNAFPGNRPGIKFDNAFMEAQTVNIHPATEPEITSIVVFSYQSGDDLLWVGCRNAVGYTQRRNHKSIGHSLNVPHVSTMILDQDIPTRNQWIDGSQNITDAPDLFEPGDDIGIGVGQYLYPWHFNEGAYAVNVTIAELIILNRAISDSERVELEGYIRGKWGI